MNLKNVGVVVIGRNEGVRLIRCLKSLPIDLANVVYVDSGSTDHSVEEAQRQGVAVFPLDLSRPFTAGRARNEGFAALMALKPDTEFVQFLDGDCELVEGWLDVAVRFLMERLDVAVVCGRRRERNPEASVYNRLCELEWDTPIGSIAACGGDSMMRVETFAAVGGFRGELMAHEEPELCMRLRESGCKIWRLDAEMTRHDAAITHFEQWWARSKRSGYAYAEVALLHRRSALAICKKETSRAVFWGGIVPVAIGIASFFYPSAIAGALIYPIQICRIAVTRKAIGSYRWTYAFYIVVAKFAEFQGVLSFLWHRLRRKSAPPIEYKNNRSSENFVSR
jgi:glycosyltransferase involved in cell wall biosynthesis